MSSLSSCLGISVSLSLLLVACNATPSQAQDAGSAQGRRHPVPLPEPSDVRPPETSTSAPTVPAMRCNAAWAQQAVGKAAVQSVIDRVGSDSTSSIVRVITPGDAVTDDYNESRLNLEVDADNSIFRATCG